MNLKNLRNCYTKNISNLLSDYNPKLKCPFCKIQIPLIQNIFIDHKTELPYLSLKCNCIPKGETKSIFLNQYFSILNEKPKCFKHPEKLPIIFCQKCGFKMCDICNSFHSMFETQHGHKVQLLNSPLIDKSIINNDILQSWEKTNSELKVKNIQNLEILHQKLLNEYNNYISMEMEVIDKMISNLGDIKKEIEEKKEAVNNNIDNIFNFAKLLYNDFFDKSGMINRSIQNENIVNIQKMNFNESLIFKYDNQFMQKICRMFNKMMEMLHKQQVDIVNRNFLNFDKGGNISDLTTLRLTKESEETNEKKNIQTTTEINISLIDNKVEYNEMKENDIKTEEKLKSDIIESSIIDNNNNQTIEQKISPINSPNNCNSNIKLDSHGSESDFNDINIIFNKKKETKKTYNNNIQISIQEMNNNKFDELDDIIQNDLNYNQRNYLIDTEQSQVKISNDIKDSSELNLKRTCISTIPAHKGAISSILQLRHNPNNSINGEIVTVGNDNSVIFWNPNNYQPLTKIISKISQINYIKELLDGTLAVCHEDNTIKLYSIPSQICNTVLIGHSKLISSIIQFNLNNIISSSYDNSIKIWSLRQKECINTLLHHSAPVTSLLVIRDNSFASSSADSTIVIWKKNKVTEILKGHIGEILVLFKIDDNTILSGGTDNFIKVWDISKGNCIGNLIKHSDSVTSISNLFDFNNNNVIFSVSQDNSLLMWNVNKRTCLNKIKNAHSQGITCGILLSNGNLATGSEDGIIKIWI